MKNAPEFLLASKLPLNTRFTLIAALAACGILLQLYVSAFLGWIPVFLASLLAALRGVSNKPANIEAGEWHTVTMEEIEDARKLIAKSRELDTITRPFRLGSCIGCGTFASMVIAVYIAVAAIGINSDTWPFPSLDNQLFARMPVGLVLAIDAATLLMPLWFFGRVNSWQPPDLSLRLEQLPYVYSKVSADPRLEFQPSLQVAPCDGGSVPVDCRLMVKLRDSSPDFMGIQLQTAINTVQGTGYPYTYCVLIAKPAFRLLEKASAVVDMPPKGGFSAGWLADSNTKKEAGFPRYLGAVIEMDRENDVEIVVVRQPTGGGGYSTSPEAALDIFKAAYALARSVLEL